MIPMSISAPCRSYRAAVRIRSDKAAIRMVARLRGRELLTEAALAAATAGRLGVVLADRQRIAQNTLYG